QTGAARQRKVCEADVSVICRSEKDRKEMEKTDCANLFAAVCFFRLLWGGSPGNHRQELQGSEKYAKQTCL
ncbi:hypothetical protein AALC16_11545, partial [Lachnospiraceae bacterium 29-91]